MTRPPAPKPPAPKPPQTPQESTQGPRLFKAIVQPIFAKRDAKGEIVDEISAQELTFVLYLPDFDKFPEKMEGALAALNQALAAQQNGSGPNA